MSTGKRVGIIIDWYLPRIGGGELYAYNLGKFLSRHGYKVSFFTLDEKNTENYHDEFPITRVPFDRGIMGKIRFYKALASFLNNVDIIQAIYCHKFAAYASIYNWRRKKPFFITLQGRGILDLPGNNWFYAKVHRFYRAVSLKSASKVIASCLEFVERAKKYIPAERIVYIPNGVDLAIFKSQSPDPAILNKYQGKKVILTVRRLVPKNGIQFLVEAAPAILREVPNAMFVLAGYGELEKYLKNRVLELGIGHAFDFLGRVDNTHVPSYLQIASVVIFPSTAEATSLACLEAMAMKKAIVASNVGGYPEMIDDNKNGFLVDLVDWHDSNYDAPLTTTPERTAELARKIVTLLKDTELAEKFGINALEKVERVFSWDILIEKVVHEYTSIKDH